jgi:excinuclease ABC subunit A
VSNYWNSLSESRTNLFSFNSPKGACDHCNGLGTVNEINPKKIIPNPKLSIKQVVLLLGEYKSSWILSNWKLLVKNMASN